MFNVSPAFKTTALSDLRSWQIYATIDGVTIPQEDIIDFELEDKMTADGFVTWGTAPARKLDLKINGTPAVDTASPLVLFIGLNNEFIKLGSFYIETNETTYTGFTTQWIAYDLTRTFADIPFDNTAIDWSSATLATLYAHLQTLVAVDTENTPAFSNLATPNPIEGNLRDFIMDIAELGGRYVHMSASTEEISFPLFYDTKTVSANITANQYIDFNLRSPNLISIDTLKSGELVAGGGEYGTIEMANSNMSQPLLNALSSNLPINHYAYELQLQGLPHIQAGDTIQLTDVYDRQYELIVGTHTLTYNGTLISQFTVSAPENSIVSMSRSIEKRIEVNNTEVNYKIDSVINDIADNSPSPIPAGMPLVKTYITPDDKMYIMQLITESMIKYNSLNDERSPDSMFYSNAGSLKDAYDNAYTGLQELVNLYSDILNTEERTDYMLPDIEVINQRISAYRAADRALSIFLVKYFKNETGNTIIDSAGVHIGTYQDTPTVNEDGSYFDVGGIENIFTISIGIPAIITKNNHNLIQGDIIYINTTGNLPTGVSNNSKYYVTPLTTNTFTISATLTGAAIGTSGTQSGIHTYYSGGANSRLTSSSLEFRYGRENRVSIESDKTRVTNAELNGATVINTKVKLPSAITLADKMTISTATSGIRWNFL